MPFNFTDIYFNIKEVNFLDKDEVSLIVRIDSWLLENGNNQTLYLLADPTMDKWVMTGLIESPPTRGRIPLNDEHSLLADCYKYYKPLSMSKIHLSQLVLMTSHKLRAITTAVNFNKSIPIKGGVFLDKIVLGGAIYSELSQVKYHDDVDTSVACVWINTDDFYLKLNLADKSIIPGG